MRLATRRTSRKRFKALVEYPGYGGLIAGATSKRLTETLQAVCEALAANDRIMPGGTFDAIKGNIPDETGLAGGSYRDGALAVKAHMVRGSVERLLC